MYMEEKLKYIDKKESFIIGSNWLTVKHLVYKRSAHTFGAVTVNNIASSKSLILICVEEIMDWQKFNHH
jgi:hypothetical protein